MRSLLLRCRGSEPTWFGPLWSHRRPGPDSTAGGPGNRDHAGAAPEAQVRRRGVSGPRAAPSA
ncbi:MAG: hypothetical protein LBE67_07300 [Kocuria palustris]|nr:hypothetical protein [Kocuria palustris]